MAHEIEEGSDGLYSICVFNAENCSDDELQEIFGKFGFIAKINRASNITFLRYQKLEDAILCIESMQGDARFNVKPGRKKGGQNNAGRNRDMSRNDTSRGRRPETGGSGDFGRPSSVSSSKRPPKLIPFPSIVPAEEGASKQQPSAKVVIIGNLNPKMGQSNVYELCTKALIPPLHVAMKTLKRPPYPNISYAFVYVRSEKEANSLVTSLNNLKLNGYKLVVSPVEKLGEEGRALLAAK